MSDVQSHTQVTRLDAWQVHEALVKERVQKTLARERMLKRDFREPTRWTEITTYLRFGVGGNMVQCALAEASFVQYTRKEWFE